jgi:hypothetical protein
VNWTGLTQREVQRRAFANMVRTFGPHRSKEYHDRMNNHQLLQRSDTRDSKSLAPSDISAGNGKNSQVWKTLHNSLLHQDVIFLSKNCDSHKETETHVFLFDTFNYQSFSFQKHTGINAFKKASHNVSRFTDTNCITYQLR